MKEYEMLRANMDDSYKAIVQYNCVLYTAVAAILAYAIKSDNYLTCLIPYLAIIPLHVLCQRQHRGICNLAAYMFVFLEGGEYHWERRHQKYDRDYKQNETGNIIMRLPGGSILQYYFISLACSAAAIYEVFCGEFDTLGKLIRACIIAALTLELLKIIKNSTTDYVKVRQDMIDKWTAIKEAEEREARAKQKAHTETP